MTAEKHDQVSPTIPPADWVATVATQGAPEIGPKEMPRYANVSDVKAISHEEAERYEKEAFARRQANIRESFVNMADIAAETVKKFTDAGMGAGNSVTLVVEILKLVRDRW